ncbi:MAG: xanthine dehydrogenase small subunit [Betaproteobacteria bacterium]
MGDPRADADHPGQPEIRFVLDGDVVRVRDVSPQTTVLEYLRERLGRTGTKEGCAEGDCGACTVIIAQRDRAVEGALAWQAVNACVRPLPTLDGKALFTVESLQGADRSLHPVQAAMVECHASQCGFCTPGFVMSLFSLYKRVHAPTRAEIDDALSGNLCRCTGYRPIIDAAQRMGALTLPTGWRGPGVDADGARVVSDEERALAATLKTLEREHGLDYTHAGQHYHAPTTLSELAALRAAHPDAQLFAGATDVGLWITKQHRELGTLICTGEVAELREIVRDDRSLSIGAAVTLSDAFAALDADYPMLAEVWARFASVPIRNAGTLGGNVANGSPIGDSMPVLIALGASVVLRCGEARRAMPLEDFYTGYRKSALAEGELIEAIRVPRARAGSEIRAYKVSKRFDQDISAVFACFHLRRAGERVESMRIGCGGMAAVPRRATRCERALEQGGWNESSIAAAQRALDADFSPMSDMRASAGYRRTALSNLLRRFWLEMQQPAAPTRVLEYATR